MNHGKCERCWWFKEHLEHVRRGYVTLITPTDHGDCYMQNDSEGHNYREVSRYSYCPDYINRKRVRKKPVWEDDVDQN